jgi:hypothetical protein
VPGQPLGHLHRGPSYVALTEQKLWLSSAGATRCYPFEDVVMVSIATLPAGAVRVDFMAGDPLVVLVADGGGFYDRLVLELEAFDTKLQMEAPFALGLHDPPPELLAAAERADRRSVQLLTQHGDDPTFRIAAEQHAADAREMLHQAQVAALRSQRAELLASRSATIGGPGI